MQRNCNNVSCGCRSSAQWMPAFHIVPFPHLNAIVVPIGQQTADFIIQIGFSVSNEFRAKSWLSVSPQLYPTHTAFRWNWTVCESQSHASAAAWTGGGGEYTHDACTHSQSPILKIGRSVYPVHRSPSPSNVTRGASQNVYTTENRNH